MTLAPPDLQGCLLSVQPTYRMDLLGQRRNAYGSAAQEVVGAILELDRIPINGSYSCCFDAKDRLGNYYEIKSVSHNGRACIYDWRLEKEKLAGKYVLYAFLVHKARKCGSTKELFKALAHVEILVVPLATVAALAARCLLKIPQQRPGDKRWGYSREGYRNGYRMVPVAELRKATNSQRVIQALLYDHTLITAVVHE